MMRILVIEDQVAAQIIAKLVLRKLGCVVDVVGTGLDALEKIESQAYNLIFMDIGLPNNMDGIEVTRRIRASAARSANAPIVALTANYPVSDESDRLYLQAGMNACLAKPLTLHKAEETLKNWSDAA